MQKMDACFCQNNLIRYFLYLPDETRPTRDTENATENVVDGYINLDEAIVELKNIFAEITGPIRGTLESLLATVQTIDIDDAATENRLQRLSREMNLLALRALKRQYICEASMLYDRSRAKWFSSLRGLRKRQENLIYSGATVEIFGPSGTSKNVSTSPSKGLKRIPVDQTYREDCEALLKSLNVAKIDILSYTLTTTRPNIPNSLRDVEDEVSFEAAYTPQELDTASIAAGIFFVTGRRDAVLAASGSATEPFSFYVDIGRLVNDCDRLKGSLLTHWSGLDVYCTSWHRFLEGCEEFKRNATEFIEKTISLVKSAVELTDTRLERPGNHKRLSEIAAQFRDWQHAFTSLADVKTASDLPLVLSLHELQKEGAKLIELAGSRALAVETYLEANKKTLLDASVSLDELAYRLETVVKAFDSREVAIKEMTDLVKTVEQQSGLRTIGNLAASLAGLEVPAEVVVDDEILEMGDLAVEMSYESNFEALVKKAESAVELYSLLSRFSKSRTFFKTHLPAKKAQLQQSSSMAIHAFEAIMEDGGKPSAERLEGDALRNEIFIRCQHLNTFLDSSVNRLEVRYHTMVSLEANLNRLNSWLDDRIPRVQGAVQMLIIMASESSLPDSYHGDVEDPAHILELYSSERVHYEGIFELTSQEIEADPSLYTYRSQTKSIQSRLDSLGSAVFRVVELWNGHLQRDESLKQDLAKESEAQTALMDRLDQINMQSGFALPPTASTRERVDAMQMLLQSIDASQNIHTESLAMVERIKELSQRCLNSDGFRLRLKRRHIFEKDPKEEQQSPSQKPTPEAPQNMSKQCANLTFRLASVDSSLKQCVEGICRQIAKVLTDAASAWSIHLGAQSDNIERMASFVELPILLKSGRREMVGSLFAGRQNMVQVSS